MATIFHASSKHEKAFCFCLFQMDELLWRKHGGLGGRGRRETALMYLEGAGGEY